VGRDATTVPLGKDDAGAAAGAFPVGASLAGRYRIVRLIAVGGMGEVYEALDGALAVRVALKTVQPRIAGDPAALARFRREIQVARTVTHPNVCRVHDLDDDDGRAFYTMELLEGPTLLDRLVAAPPDAEEARRWIGEVCAGLGAVHAAGIIHRDLKPNNVIVVAGRGAVITDFGVAQRADDADDGDRAGTPRYMAPELHQGAAPSVASDLYALGVMVGELGVADPQLAAVARRCTAADPAARPASAVEVTRMLAPRRSWRPLAAAAFALGAGVAVALAWPAGAPTRDLHRDGQARLRALDGRGARALLRRAPPTPQVLCDLSGAEYLAGDLEAAQAAARRAREMIAGAPDRYDARDRWLAEARWAEAIGDWTGAVEAWEELVVESPDAEPWFSNAAAQLEAGHRDFAGYTLGGLRARPDAVGDPRIDLLQARLDGTTATAYHAVASATARGDAHLIGLAQLALAEAAIAEGDPAIRDQALAAADAALAAADRCDRIHLLRLRGEVDQALALARECGDRRAELLLTSQDVPAGGGD
jgi:serine/threonine-protein kinase